jgi:hypothetical protein
MALLPSFSEIAKSLRKGETEEAERQIVQLREAAHDLQEENLALREEIEKLREERSTRASLDLSGGVYWRLEDGERVGPFCRFCYDEHHRLARLLDGERYAAKTHWICRVCNRVFD